MSEGLISLNGGLSIVINRPLDDILDGNTSSVLFMKKIS